MALKKPGSGELYTNRRLLFKATAANLFDRIGQAKAAPSSETCVKRISKRARGESVGKAMAGELRWHADRFRH